MRTRSEVVTFIQSDDNMISKRPQDSMTLEVFDSCKPDVNISAADELGNAIAVTIQLKDSTGSNMAAKRLLEVWLSDTAEGVDCTTAPDGGITLISGTLMQAVVANKRLRVLTDATGKVVLSLSESSYGTFYVNVLSGNEVVSLAVEFV